MKFRKATGRRIGRNNGMTSFKVTDRDGKIAEMAISIKNSMPLYPAPDLYAMIFKLGLENLMEQHKLEIEKAVIKKEEDRQMRLFE